MDTWYASGTEVVFACGGSIWESAAESAVKYNGKVIGVDTDQSPVINSRYGDGLTVTSATKGLGPTTVDALTDILVNGNWSDYAGKIETLGLISEDPYANYVQIAPTTQFEEGKFSEADYAELVAAILNGTVTVSSDISAEPATQTMNVSWLGTLQ